MSVTGMAGVLCLLTNDRLGVFMLVCIGRRD